MNMSWSWGQRYLVFFEDFSQQNKSRSRILTKNEIEMSLKYGMCFFLTLTLQFVYIWRRFCWIFQKKYTFTIIFQSVYILQALHIDGGVDSRPQSKCSTHNWFIIDLPQICAHEVQSHRGSDGLVYIWACAANSNRWSISYIGNSESQYLADRKMHRRVKLIFLWISSIFKVLTFLTSDIFFTCDI